MPSRKTDKISIVSAVLPFRGVVARMTLLLLLLVIGGVIFVTRSNNAYVETVRVEVMDVMAKVVDVISAPVRWGTAAKEATFDAINIYTENEFLRRQNQRLMHMQSMATQLAGENAKFRRMLNFVPEPELRFVTARVIMDISNSFGRAAMVNAGVRDGVGKGQIVVNDRGLVGRILEVGDTSARVLLITDINSRIPVITSTSEERGILMGNNQNHPLMRHIPIETQIEPGETVMTSGDGQYYPSGLPVGVVKEVNDKEAVVSPFVNIGKLEYVNIIRFNVDRQEKAAAPKKTATPVKTEGQKAEPQKESPKKEAAPIE